jgi:hypothetical protein
MMRSWTSGSYEISCTARANEYKGKSPAICSHIAMGSTRSIIDNIVQWKKAADSTARAPERGPPLSSTTTEDAFIPPK